MLARNLSKVFPSPCGEMGIRNPLSFVSAAVAFYKNRFPSPCGEMGIRNEVFSDLFFCKGIVSVPLRGNGYKELCAHAEWYQSIGNSDYY